MQELQTMCRGGGHLKPPVEAGKALQKANEKGGLLDRAAAGHVERAASRGGTRSTAATLPRVNRVADDASRTVRSAGPRQRTLWAKTRKVPAVWHRRMPGPARASPVLWRPASSGADPIKELNS